MIFPTSQGGICLIPSRVTFFPSQLGWFSWFCPRSPIRKAPWSVGLRLKRLPQQAVSFGTGTEGRRCGKGGRFGNRELLFMDKIRLTSWYGKYPINYKVLYIQGGCLGFLNHQQYEANPRFRSARLDKHVWGVPCCLPTKWDLWSHHLRGWKVPLKTALQGLGRFFPIHRTKKLVPDIRAIWIRKKQAGYFGGVIMVARDDVFSDPKWGAIWNPRILKITDRAFDNIKLSVVFMFAPHLYGMKIPHIFVAYFSQPVIGLFCY